MPRKRKPVGQRSRERRDLLGGSDYFDHLKAHAFKGDLNTVMATMKALGFTPEQCAEELNAPWYQGSRDLAQALADGKVGVVRSDGRIIAGPGTGLEDADSIRRKLNRERAKQGQGRPRGRPKKRGK